MSANDKAKWGLGYQTEAERLDKFVLADDLVRFDKAAAGGAVPVHGYHGPWPIFGRPSERLGGIDVLEVPDKDGQGSQSTPATSNAAAGPASNAKTGADEPDAVALPGLKGPHYAKRPQWMCRQTAGCTPCDKSDLHRPYCQPYGNHAVIECRKIEVTTPPERAPKITQAEQRKAKAKAKEKLKAEAAKEAAAKAAAAAAAVGNGLDKGAAIAGNQRDLAPIESRSIWWEDYASYDHGDIALQHLYGRQEMFVSGHVFKGYQMCGRDRTREAFDYAEFVALNLILALAGIFVLLRRQRYLAVQHQSMVARRIGRT